MLNGNIAIKHLGERAPDRCNLLKHAKALQTQKIQCKQCAKYVRGTQRKPKNRH